MCWEHLSTTKPKAIKPHKCVWCGESIPPGEQHVKTTGKMEGDFQSNRMHADCDVACGKMLKESGEDCFVPYEYKRGSIELR